MAKLQGRRGEALAVQSAASCAIGGVISGFPFFSVERHINVTLGWIWHNTLHIEYKKYACLFSASLCFTLPSFCPPTHTTPSALSTAGRLSIPFCSPGDAGTDHDATSTASAAGGCCCRCTETGDRVGKRTDLRRAKNGGVFFGCIVVGHEN